LSLGLFVFALEGRNSVEVEWTLDVLLRGILYAVQGFGDMKRIGVLHHVLVLVLFLVFLALVVVHVHLLLIVELLFALLLEVGGALFLLGALVGVLLDDFEVVLVQAG